MATWLTHLRVAEKVSDLINIKDKSYFFAGSIAPDSDIPPDVSHRCVDGDKTTCDAQGFVIKYVLDNPQTVDLDFYWGYYIHLLTDILWHEQKIVPLNYENKDNIKVMKQKWRSVDHYFLAAHRDYNPLHVIKYAMEHSNKYEKQWFDYYTVHQFKKLIGGILNNFDHVQIQSRDEGMETQIEQFIDECVEFITLKLIDY